MAQHEPVARIEALYRNECPEVLQWRAHLCPRDGSIIEAIVEVRQNKYSTQPSIQIGAMKEAKPQLPSDGGIAVSFL